MPMLTLFRSSRRRGGAMPAHYGGRTPSALLGYLLLGYGLLIVTGSLYPFAGWRWPVESPWDFLMAPWPRYLLSWEIPLNVAGYVPWGLFLATRVLAARSPPVALAIATLGGLAMSLAMETLQAFIPGRIASNLDVASNGLGALVGAGLAVVIERAWDVSTRFRRLLNGLLVEGASSDFAVMLLLAWLFAQINPALGLLGTVGFASMAEQAGLMAYSATRYFVVEALLAAANALFLMVLLRLLTRSTPVSLAGVVLLALASAVLKSLGGALLLRVSAPWLWATPGALAGMVLAAGIFVVWSRQWAGTLKWLGVVAFIGILGFATLLPENPYLNQMLQPVASGHLAHLMGATWGAAQVWPWLGLLCLGALPAAWSRRRLNDWR